MLLFPRYQKRLLPLSIQMAVLIPYQRGDLVSLAHSRCTVVTEAHGEEGTVLQLRMPPAFVSQFKPFEI